MNGFLRAAEISLILALAIVVATALPIPGDVSGYIPGNLTPDWPGCAYLVTAPATGTNSSHVTLNGDSSVPVTAWFIYGTMPGVYPFRTKNQTTTGGSAGIFNRTIGSDGSLIFNKPYYFRAASAACYGLELNFTMGPVPAMTTTTFGAEAWNVIENGTDDPAMVATSFLAPYSAVFGLQLVISIIIGMIFVGIAYKNDSTAPAIILMMEVGFVLMGYTLPEFVQAASACFILGIAALIYTTFTKSR